MSVDRIESKVADTMASLPIARILAYRIEGYACAKGVLYTDIYVALVGLELDCDESKRHQMVNRILGEYRPIRLERISELVTYVHFFIFNKLHTVYKQMVSNKLFAHVKQTVCVVIMPHRHQRLVSDKRFHLI